MVKFSLEERKQKILQVVIHHYIRTAKPVGSQTITEDYKFGLSSATIRNILSSLEKDGYLSHPHTSSGRVPTDKGYRFYVDSLRQLQQLTHEEEQRIDHEYESQRLELDRIMQETSRMLSLLSHYTAFVLTPSMVNDRIKRLELIPIEPGKILAVLMTEAGLIRHRMINFDEAVSVRELSELNRILNRNITGLNLKNIGLEIFKKLKEEKARQQKYMDFLDALLDQAFNLSEEGELYVEGASNILQLPEFRDYDKIRNIFKVMDEKKMLTDVLEQKIQEHGVKVLIGEENTCKDLQECSIVTSTYKAGDKTLGALGIIGPKRMEYSKMIALVDYFSKMINKTLNRQPKEKEKE